MLQNVYPYEGDVLLYCIWLIGLKSLSNIVITRAGIDCLASSQILHIEIRYGLLFYETYLLQATGLKYKKIQR